MNVSYHTPCEKNFHIRSEIQGDRVLEICTRCGKVLTSHQRGGDNLHPFGDIEERKSRKQQKKELNEWIQNQLEIR